MEGECRLDLLGLRRANWARGQRRGRGHAASGRAGELGGVALVGFDPVARAFRDERGRDDLATHAHLQEPAGDPETAAAGLVADVDVGELATLLFGDAAHGALQRVLRGGDRSLRTWLRVAGPLQDGDDSLLFMDIKSEVECAGRG
ncbi:hypothetical protein HNR46_003558 [Haloferula luteola]|uniref:Uncharacterized protein n=1 Tax=Haloferula luteola TaxID=595692 RepID=A0A840V6L1_9BACT|nr:hypothetical protein [Haloferula luteola]MBB5353303.1 hypothetical protein [Haloferula luteola]